MNKLLSVRFAFIASASLAAAGCGTDDPNPENAPTPASTVAEISGSAVKGTLVGANVSVVPLNGTAVSISGDTATNASGQIPLLALSGEPGFAIGSIFRIEAATDANSTMVCDAMACGDATLGENVPGAALGNSQLETLVWVQAALGSAADGAAESEFQVNVLTTLATRLIESAIAEGQNISAPATFEPAQVSFSTTLLRILGVETSNVNVFAEVLLSAEAAANFDGASNNTVLLSLLNASFAEFASGSTLAESLASATALVDAAAAGDFDAAVALRTQLLNAMAANTVITDLGLVAADLIDPTLSLVAEVSSSGPIQEYTTLTNVAAATITARGSIGPAEDELKVFDGDINTKWLDNTAVPSAADPAWVQIQFAAAVPVSVLGITSANDADSRDPENFNIQASNDGASWITLGEFAGVSFDERFETRDFAFTNSLPFTHYRIEITKNKGDDSLMQIAEIELLGPIYPGMNHALGGGTITARGSISPAEDGPKVFDGDVNTKWLDNTAVPSAAEPAWVQITFALPEAVDSLAITSANDADSRDPENFDLQASNDGGTTWLTLGEWAGQSFDERFQRQSFTLNNGLAFGTYRFNVTKNKGDDSLMQIAEIELIGPDDPATDKSSSPGVLITARGAISPAEDGPMAFDDDVMTKWLDNTAVPSAADPAWVQIELAQPAAVNFLGLTSANDADSRDPENFNVQGSNDGTFWATLGEWSGVAFDERFQRQTFRVANDVGFTFYRFNVTKNKGDDSLMQIAEIELVGPPFVAIDYSGVAGAVYSARASISPAESETSAFDDDQNTKWLDNGGVPIAADPAWVQVDLPQPAIVNALALTSANDADSRDPENFDIQGSNDAGATWTTLASFSGEAFSTRFERRSFPFQNGRSYQTYRVNITKNKGDDGLMQIAEIELTGPQIP